MWKLDKPKLLTQETFRTCISRVRDIDLRTRLEQIEDDIVQYSKNYEEAAFSAELYRLPVLATGEKVGNLVDKTEMEECYTSRMAHKGSPGRKIYDQLLSNTPHGRCPFCGQRIVSTLDHLLPKKYYPVLAVTPINLVPCCADCNKAKHDKRPTCSEEVLFHPYFDNIQDDSWLRAQVIETKPVALKFFVDPPTTWEKTKVKRAKEHFRILQLASLYGSLAAEELTSIRYFLTELFKNTGEEGIRIHLQDQAESRRQDRLNSWMTATYTALSESQWFCSGGFRLD